MIVAVEGLEGLVGVVDMVVFVHEDLDSIFLVAYLYVLFKTVALLFYLIFEDNGFSRVRT